MHTFRKLPTNKPSKVKTDINKGNILFFYTKLDYVSAMITQESELSNALVTRIWNASTFKGLFSLP